MYGVSADLTEYFREIDPKKRLVILDSLPESGAVDFVREVYNDRYSDHEGKGRKNIDWWLWRCICLQILYGRGRFLRKFRDKEVTAIISELRMNDTDESHRAVLYHEYRNTARRYLSTCKSGDYASGFMGFRKASDEEKIIKACADIWQMSGGIAHSSGNDSAMLLWVEAFRDELMNYDDICREEYKKLREEDS